MTKSEASSLGGKATAEIRARRTWLVIRRGGKVQLASLHDLLQQKVPRRRKNQYG
jgi:hypothetical protein